MVRYALPELAKRQGQSDGVAFRLFRLRLTLPRREVESVRGNVEAGGGTLEAAVAIAQARLATLCPMGMDERTWDALPRQTQGEMAQPWQAMPDMACPPWRRSWHSLSGRA
ncbi:hypothetical protein [Azospirillum sp. TSO5]|uniref:hypothetical protein n=1 Tax=Azospirillum sp. TSO5 TaxID=716760 RepID=UPI0011B20668|nr:hypothetical protein [Azospirillum sp. TSO5]